MDRRKIILAAKTSLRNKEGKAALDYLRNKRCFSDEVIEKFDIGYCPPNIDHQLNGRIIVPIYDAFGEVVALSTRHLDENHSVRFWHESFDKSFFIYGLNFAKKNIIKHGKAVLVEGEFDVAALHSVGVTIAVGISGSAFTLTQAVDLARYCSEVYLVFDGDEAGRTAIQRSMEMHSKYHFGSSYPKFSFIPVYLPSKLDPDDYVKTKGASSFIELLKNAKADNKLWSNN